MTNEELLAKIDNELVTHGQRGNIVKHSFALRSVVELCNKWDTKGSYCLPIEDVIQVIEKELK